MNKSFAMFLSAVLLCGLTGCNVDTEQAVTGTSGTSAEGVSEKEISEISGRNSMDQKTIIERENGIINYHIPVYYREGEFSLSELEANDRETIDITYYEDYNKTFPDCYEPYGRTLEYPIYDGKSRYFGFSENDISETLRAVYNEDGHIKNITVKKDGELFFLHMYFPDRETVEKEIKEISEEFASQLAEEIIAIKEPMARVFVDYFCGCTTFDIHAVPVTEEHRKAKEKEYPQFPDIADNPGDFEEYAVFADHSMLTCILKFQDDDNGSLCDFTAKTIADLLEKKIDGKIIKTDDYYFSAEEYD